VPLSQLGKSQWQGYFDRFSRTLGPKRVEIEVTGLGLGHQIQAEWIPLIGVSYDPRNDLVAVVAEGVEHIIRKPTQIQIEHDAEWVRRLEVVDIEGNRHTLTLKEPLSLPAS
jgi:hypothetical protein